MTPSQLHLVLDIIDKSESEFALERQAMPDLEPLTDIERKMQPPGGGNETRAFNGQQSSGQGMAAGPRAHVQQTLPVNPRDIEFWSMQGSGFDEWGGNPTTPAQPPPRPPPSYPHSFSQ